MAIKKVLIPALLIGSAVALAARRSGRPAAAAANAASRGARYDAIDAYVEGQRRRLNIPGISLAIVEGGKITHLRGFGRARPGGEAPTPQTPFAIGSVTKSFTALAVMQLVEAGKVELDAPVQRYLPWFRVADPQASAQITVRHLLNQTSGFSQPTGMAPLANLDNSPGATERQARTLAACKLARPPGSAFEYSNVNYNLLGLVIEAASGETYPDYIQQHIFEPLEMRHSHTSKAAAKQDGMAVGHLSWFGFPRPVPDLPMSAGSLPSGQLIASTEDMAHYLIAQLNEGCYKDAQILSPEGMAEMHRPVAENRAMGHLFGHYGMGWMVEDADQGRRVSHNGFVPDFFGYVALLPGQKRGLVLLANANHTLVYFALTAVGEGAATLLAGGRPKAVPVGAIPWAQRSLLLIPLLQIAGVTAMFGLLRRWRRDPATRPSDERLWGQHILLPLIPNLLAALTLIPVLGKMGGFLRLFLPDVAWIALISGAFAGVWAFLRTGMMLRELRKPPSPAMTLSPERKANHD